LVNVPILPRLSVFHSSLNSGNLSVGARTEESLRPLQEDIFYNYSGGGLNDY